MSNPDILARQLAACGVGPEQADSDLSGWGYGASTSIKYHQTLSALSKLRAKYKGLRASKSRALVKRRNASFGKKRQWTKRVNKIERDIHNTKARIRFLKSELASMPKPMARMPIPRPATGHYRPRPAMSPTRKLRIGGLKRQIRMTQHALSRTTDGAKRASLLAQLASLKKQLAGELALGSAAQRAATPRRLTPSQLAKRKAQRITLLKEIKATKAEIARMEKMSRVARMSRAAHARLAQLKARLKMLQKERAALASGGIILRRRRVSAGAVAHQKPVLRPQPGLQELTEDEVRMLATAISSRIPRRFGETRAQYLLRLRAYMRRAALRYGNQKAVALQIIQTGKPVPTKETAVAVAVTETLTQDTEALEAEADQNVEVVSGGEEMDESLDDLNEVVEDIAESANPEAMMNEADEATGDTPATTEGLESLEIDELLAVADEATGPEIEVEDIVESANDATLFLVEEEGEWYEDPRILLGGAAIVLAILVLKK
jgi:hypothetical protein